jgi:hypothetical protein
MATIWHTAENGLRGMFSGGLGGLVAGYLYGLVLNVYVAVETQGRNLNFPFGLLIGFAIPASIVGLLVGTLVGLLVGLTPLVNHPSLLRLTQLLGSTLVALTTFLILGTSTPLWLLSILMLGSLFAGYLGGTVAFRRYQRRSG